MGHIKPVLFPKLKQHLKVQLGKDSSSILWPDKVQLLPLKKHTDDRGFFMEITRFPSLEGLGFIPKQTSLSETKPGVTKAFHYHQKQSDLFCPIFGSFQIVLFDVRVQSATLGHGYSIFTHPDHPFLLHIPPGVAHGYRIHGKTPATMLYIMNREYDPTDELRADWDDSSIGFPWSA